MKKITIVFSIFFLIIACNSTKRTQKIISNGNYDSAIRLAVKKLRKNKTSKKKQHLIVLLEEAYTKAVDQDNRSLASFKLDQNPAIIESIYETYIALDKRQNLIRPILPLYIKSKNRNAAINFNDYSIEINNAKTTLSDYLYANAKKLLKNRTKKYARKAYEELSYLEKVNPNFKDVNKLLDEAHFIGTNFVEVKLINNTNQIIPRRLEDDLLDFNSYGLDKFWTVFHSKKDTKIKYDYRLKLLFNRIEVSPERFHEKQVLLEKEIIDGFEYVLDRDGNVAVDSLGNSIKKDKYIIVSADYFMMHQEKASHIDAEVILTNLQTNQEMEIFPIASEFIFVYDFAEMSGDIRALNHDEKELIKFREIPFPSNEQMVYDTGEDLKNRLKDFISDLKI